MSIYHKTSVQIQEELKEIEKAQGNPRAFSVLYDRYYRDIYVFIFRRLESEAHCEDIVSQVFFKAMTNIHKYKFKGVPFSAWLFRIASNELNQYFRKSNKTRHVSIEEEGVHKLSEESDDLSLDPYLLSNILNKLDPKEVELLELRYFEALSIKETAYILGITESNVKVKVFRLLNKIKKKVAKEGWGNE